MLFPAMEGDRVGVPGTFNTVSVTDPSTCMVALAEVGPSVCEPTATRLRPSVLASVATGSAMTGTHTR